MPRRKPRRPKGAVLLRPDEIERMRRVGLLAWKILNEVEDLVRPGVSTQAIDDLVLSMTKAAGAISAPLGYPPGGKHPFPRHCCTSVNEVVCHGIPNPDHILRDGDIINVDVTPKLDGFHGDTSRTFLVGEVGEEARHLVEVTYECLKRGIEVVRPGATVGDIGHVIQTYAEGEGYSVVRQFAGHGIGRVFHGLPTISHYGRPGTGMAFLPGMTFTIEPMINVGNWHARTLLDHWTAITEDGSLSAQFEHTVTVTEDGVEILTLPEGESL